MPREEAKDEEGGANNNVTIEHKVTNSAAAASTSRAAPSLAAALMTPAGMGALLFAGAMTGGFGYFFNEWFQIPGLKDQVEDLEKEVDRLEGEVDRLEDANDEFESLNDRLNSSVLQLQNQTQILNASLDFFEEQNLMLNLSNQELDMLLDDFRDRNAEFNASNMILNATVLDLQDEVANLTTQVDDLEEQTRTLNGRIDELNGTVLDLQLVRDDLNASVIALEGNVTDLSNEVDELASFNDDLLSAIAFLDEASGDISSLRLLLGNLTDAIEQNRDALIGRTELSYRDTIRGWDCAIRDAFRTQPFGGNFDVPIGADAYTLVQRFFEIRIANPLCLDVAEIERYIDETIIQSGNLPPVTATITELDDGITEYALASLDYYFPTTAEVGLTSDDWAAADYVCENLPADKKFRFF
mmetsp:Transcript_22897/g.64875  ORF Transcript_22897/g.64875 Transcript_22897/m.64875 type:complete len:414 (-) Transcript_22897:112-1353(-)|eukprot:CAMPEP_0119565720 /NCGR_PEP_ID=MMETSP1352-20130426/30956_1 /TAXON_ID=265584 /ORGANISM="Stauroneis constricta, Strain CCMP1120" /LENGTH=413 /DNA_ID=CAMNT_0007614705 /DNA_START=75 /DNA_END=1316 /DNA_ORIENTATION=-